MTKKLNTAGVLGEMREQSVHFRRPEPAGMEQSPTTPENKAQPAKAEPIETKTERFSERKSERTEERTEKRSELPVKRLSRRYSFEFYDDQITKLKRLKHAAEMSGQKVSLSDMARQALDDYLQDK